jgi:hypothetical protein
MGACPKALGAPGTKKAIPSSAAARPHGFRFPAAGRHQRLKDDTMDISSQKGY